MLFKDEQIITAQDIYNKIRHLLQLNNKYPVELNIRQLRTYSLVSFYDIDSLRIQCGKTTSYIWFAQTFKKLLSAYPRLTVNTPQSEKLWTRVPITSIDDINGLQELLLETYDAACLLGASEPFSCCSRYSECSDNKKCVHPSLKFSRDCQYRKNLLNGKIFYGVNRTITNTSLC